MAQKELQEEKNMLADTVEDLRKTVEQCGTESEKEHNYDLQDSNQPDSLTSNSSFHSTQDELELPVSQTDKVTEEEEPERGKARRKEEIHSLHQAFESVRVKLIETREERRSLQVQRQPECLREYNVEVREKEREAELMDSLAELQAKLSDTQERFHQALEEVEELRVQIGLGDNNERQEQQARALMLEHEVKQLRAQLLQSESQNRNFLLQIKHLEQALRRAEVKHKENELQSIQHEEAQEEIKMLQAALRGTVSVEAAAKDFKDMKGELSEVISGLQRRLLELSHSYSDTKSQLSAAQKELSVSSASTSPTSEQQQEQSEALKRVEEIKACLLETESKYFAAQQEISQLQQEAEKQLDNSVTLTDHTQVVAALGNAIKDLEKELESVKEQLQLKTSQLDALQNGFSTNKSLDDSVLLLERDMLKDQLKGEVSHLTEILQGALRKQDEMALEAADAWQQARNYRAEGEALQELMMSREKDNQSLSNRLAESQDAVHQLKQLVENHVASEREKNKRIDDLSREVCKLKDALNSLSQLSYNSSSPSKRQQQNQQQETMQQQIKQLQYQLADSKKQHQEIVSVYRMHLLYAAQGQMDEDVQKALKQILIMCKMPSQVKKAC
uniref:Uncharacterized protein n=1 Tax=Knipowitschia caucasica TaxID=637954 RepID=A0AAV2IY88_KNICA